jgi:hypothetical protein
MAQNRKYRAASVRFGPALKAFLLCLLLGGAGVGYVWQKSLIDQLGHDIKKREVDLAELEHQNEVLRGQLARLRSPRFLDQRVRALDLGLAPPPQSHVWLLPEPVAPPRDRTFQTGALARPDAPPSPAAPSSPARHLAAATAGTARPAERPPAQPRATPD